MKKGLIKPGKKIAHIIRDVLTDVRAAGAVNGTPAIPGPGNRVVVDTGSLLAISGELVMTAKLAASGTFDPGQWIGGVSRLTGRTLFSKFSVTESSLNGILGFDNNQATLAGGGAISLYGNGFIRWLETSALVTGDLVPFDTKVVYEIAIVLRTAGAFLLIHGGEFLTWTLIWVGNTNVSATLYPSATSDSLGYSVRYFDVLDIGGLWATDNGIATQVLAGARNIADVFTHEADCILEFTVTTLPAPGDIDFHFRIQDATNYWQVKITPAGNLELNEIVVGASTTRGSAAAVIVNGDRVVIAAVGKIIRVYEANNLRITYAPATNFITETDGELDALGTGGAVSDIISWPRTITGEAYADIAKLAPDFGLTYLPDNWANWYPTASRFVWISDVHRSEVNVEDSWNGVCRHIRNIQPDFIIDTGDVAATASAIEYIDYLAGIEHTEATLYTVPGNHDGSYDFPPDGAYDNLGNYLAAGLTEHFTVDIGNFRIIGFTTYQDTLGIAVDSLILPAEKAWVLNELANVGSKTPILATHYNMQFLIDGGSWPTFLADVTTYGIKGFLSGHDHAGDCATDIQNGCTNVLGGSVYGFGSVPDMMIWYVFSDRMVLEFQSADTPYDDFGPLTVPVYATVTIMR